MEATSAVWLHMTHELIFKEAGSEKQCLKFDEEKKQYFFLILTYKLCFIYKISFYFFEEVKNGLLDNKNKLWRFAW